MFAVPLGIVAGIIFAFGDLTLFILWLVGAWFALNEFWILTGVANRKAIFPLTRLGEIAVLLIFFFSWKYPSGYNDILLALLLPLFFIVQLFAHARGDRNFIREVAMVVLGVIYIGGLASFMFKLRHLQDAMELSGAVQFADTGGFFTSGDIFHFAIFAAIASFGSDTTAYLTGKFFGKTKLSPKISPKKTITGLMGAMIGSATAVTLYAWLIGLVGQIQIHELIAFGALAAAFSQLGDLTVSAIKRESDFSDTGWIMGAHGGILDRCDGFIFALPATYIFFLLVL